MASTSVAVSCLIVLSLTGCASQPPPARPEPEEAPQVSRREEPAVAIPPRETGRRTAAVSNAVIRRHRDRFRRCYDKARDGDGSLEGRVELVFTIRPDGAVAQAEVDRAKSTLKSDSLDACMVGVVKGVSFPPADEEVGSKMHYPFEFTPQGSR